MNTDVRESIVFIRYSHDSSQGLETKINPINLNKFAYDPGEMMTITATITTERKRAPVQALLELRAVQPNGNIIEGVPDKEANPTKEKPVTVTSQWRIPANAQLGKWKITSHLHDKEHDQTLDDGP